MSTSTLDRAADAVVAHHFLRTGSKVHDFQLAGNPEASAVLLVGGRPDSWPTWQDRVIALARHHFVIAPALLLDATLRAAHVDHVLQQLGVTRVHVVSDEHGAPLVDELRGLARFRPRIISSAQLGSGPLTGVDDPDLANRAIIEWLALREQTMEGMRMKVHELGHTFLKVRDRERSETFYTDVLGLEVAARMESPPMTFFTLGNHHDFGILEVGDGPEAAPNSPGLFHVAFKVGDSLDELRSTKTDLEAAGVAVDFAMDHSVTKSVYVSDPDGNSIELYVDVSDEWKRDPNLVTVADLIELD